MDEYVDILNLEGEYTGEKALKSEAHRKGLFHPTVHLWFYSADAKVLIQQRGRDKDTHPLLWDVSVAGHMGAGETPLQAALREAEEEIGVKINAESLQKIGVFRSVQEHGPELVDCEYHHTFIALLPVPFASLRKQESEVEALQMIPLVQLAEEVWGLANPSKYVPHDTAYYKAVIRAIKEQL